VRNALAPLTKNELERRRAAQARAEDGYEDEAVDTAPADTSVVKPKKPSLKDRIKAKFSSKN
jgi:hypothetical protein